MTRHQAATQLGDFCRYTAAVLATDASPPTTLVLDLQEALARVPEKVTTASVPSPFSLQFARLERGSWV